MYCNEKLSRHINLAENDADSLANMLNVTQSATDTLTQTHIETHENLALRFL